MGNKRTIAIAGFMLVATALTTGCANWQTVDRTTQMEEGTDTAVHLDAQQRLVVFTRGDKKIKYCAEPSPDAISAYAASLGLSFSDPTQTEASLVNSLQSATAGIGLRTQSITLMRDALYRMCEASNNGHLDELQVALFLRRSQYLTAVVLAIEQLTGTVLANQIPLTPNVLASANLLLNQQHLDQAKDKVQELQKEVTAAENGLNGLKEITDTGQADGETTKIAKDNLEDAKERLKEAMEVRDAIRVSRDATLAHTVAPPNTEQYSIPVERNQLNAETAMVVSTAVEKMVLEVLEKNDTIDACLAYRIGRQNKKTDTEETTSEIKDLCNEVLLSGFGGLERARQDAEKARDKAAQTSNEAAQTRQDAEKARQDAEKARQDAEKARDKAAQTSNEAAQTRQDAEKARQDAEKARQDAEKARDDAEKYRQDADKARQDADKARQDAEKARQDAEKARQDAEKARQDAEKARQDAEKARDKAPQTSNEAAQTRQDVEKDRDEVEKLPKQLDVTEEAGPPSNEDDLPIEKEQPANSDGND